MIEVTNIIKKELKEEFKKIGIQYIFMPYVKKIKIKDIEQIKAYNSFYHSLFYCNGIPFNFDNQDTKVHYYKYNSTYYTSLSGGLKSIIENHSNISEIYNFVAEQMLFQYKDGMGGKFKNDKKFYFQNYTEKQKYCDLKKQEIEIIEEYNELQINVNKVLSILDENNIKYNLEDIKFDLLNLELINDIDKILNFSFEELAENLNPYYFIKKSVIDSKYKKEKEEFIINEQIKHHIRFYGYARGGKITIETDTIYLDKKIYAEYDKNSKKVIINYENFKNKIEKELLKLIERDNHLFYQLRNYEIVESVENVYIKEIYKILK